MILREPGSIVPFTLPEERHLPFAERAKFYFRVLSEAEFANTMEWKKEVDDGEIDDAEFLARILGQSLERIETVELDIDGSRVPLELEFDSARHLSRRMVAILYPFTPRLCAFVQMAGVIDEQEAKNS